MDDEKKPLLNAAGGGIQAEAPPTAPPIQPPPYEEPSVPCTCMCLGCPNSVTLLYTHSSICSSFSGQCWHASSLCTCEFPALKLQT